MEQALERRLVGRVVGTERQPNTAFHFYFWASPMEPIGIGTLVTACAEETPDRLASTTWAVVVEALGYNDLNAPLSDFIGMNRQPESYSPTERPEIRLYKAAVLRRVPEDPVQPAPITSVYLAGKDDVLMALNIDRIPEERRIPMGLYKSGELTAPVYVDSDFLLGPEAGHLNVTGTSGLAAKTSLIEFLLASIFAKYHKSVAVICFNVKGPDLLFLDHPPIEPMSEEDSAMYEQIGFERKPFENVIYYAPLKEDGYNPATLRTHEDVTSNLHPLQWGLPDVMKYTEVMLNQDDIDVKADAFLQFVRQRAVDTEVFEFDPAEIAQGCPKSMPVKNFTDLEEWFKTVIGYIEHTNQTRWRSHAQETIRKVYNRLRNLPTRYAGLLTEDENRSDLFDKSFEDRSVYVVDVAQLRAEAQDLVFTRIIAELRDRMEKRELGVDTVIVVVDELNQYAPSSGKETYVGRTVRDIAARGRYLGLVLFGAQQFRSQVDRQVVGNCSTALWGQIEMEELAQPGYGVFDPAVKQKLGTLSPGQMLLKHPYYQQPVFIQFPRPFVMRGRDGVGKFKPASDVPLDRAIWRQLRTLDNKLTPTVVADTVALAGDMNDQATRKQLITALCRTMCTRPSDPLSYFAKQIPKKPGSRTVPVSAIGDPEPYPTLNSTDDPDPFE